MYFVFWLSQAVYTVLREAEDRSVAPIPIWEIPIWKDISPRQRKVAASLKLINDTLDDLIATCKVWSSIVGA
jgi:beta-ring hydroxylase